MAASMAAPMPPPGPVPNQNVHNTRNHVLGVAEELAVLENVPGLPRIHQARQQLQQQPAAITNSLDRLDDIQARNEIHSFC